MAKVCKYIFSFRGHLCNAVGGVGVSVFPGKKCYKGVRFNVISVTGGGWGSNAQEKALRNTGMAPNFQL